MNTTLEIPKLQKDTQIHITGKKPFHILVADDDKEMRHLLSQVFFKAGFKVTECSDGVDLLMHLESFLFLERNGSQAPDLIISDIRMPGITGIEILEGLQNIKNCPPMIMITAFGDDKTHDLADEFNAAAMFDKPFDIDDLLKEVNTLLSR